MAESKNYLSIPKLRGFAVSLFGIFLLSLAFLISLSLTAPTDFEEFEAYYNTVNSLYFIQFLGLVITFAGIVDMISSFYKSWKNAINKIYEKLE